MKTRSSRLRVGILTAVSAALLAALLVLPGPRSLAERFEFTTPALANSLQQAHVPDLGPAHKGVSDGAQLPASGTFSPVLQKATPAVVSIKTARTIKASEQQQRMPFFFFGPGDGEGSPFGPDGEGPQAPGRRQYGEGSGVILSSDGLIVTNHHVVDDASKVEVYLSDRRHFEAKVLGADSKTDIAVLKIEGKDLPVLPLGNSDNVKVGDLALAIGNPFGLGQTVTMGIIGATGRGDLGIEDYEDFIQTDAAINTGNSGGALINTRGELIGINTAILSRGGGNQGVGFAVPVNMAHNVIAQLVEKGSVSRGFLGVGIQNMTPDMASAFKVPDASGAVVRSVEPNSPGAKAGLERGDVIRKVNGVTVLDARELRLKIGAMAPGSTVTLAVLRDGAEKTVSAKLAEATDKDQKAEAPGSNESSALAGVQVDELTPAIARQLQVDPTTKGVVVSNVDQGSAAYEAGLRRGDVVMEVGRKPVASVSEFRTQVKAAGTEPILLLVAKGENVVFIAVEPR